MFIEALGPKRQPAGAAFHEADAQFRITIEHAFADHVHHGDHQFEGKRRHVHVGVLAKALAAGAHDAGNTEDAVMAGLRMNAERHADRLGAIVDRIEHAVAHVI